MKPVHNGAIEYQAEKYKIEWLGKNWYVQILKFSL
jgi:hypothetical protein